MTDTVERKGRSCRYAAGHREALDTGETPRGRGRDAGLYGCSSQRNQVLNLAADKRKLQDLRIIDNLPNAGRSRFDHARVRRHLNALGQLPDFKGCIDGDRAVDLKQNPSLCERTESRQGNVEPIWTDRQIRQNVISGLIADCFPDETCIALRGVDFHTG